MKLGGWVGWVTRTSQSDFGGPEPELASQWDPKRKLFSVVKVCSRPSAVLVAACNALIFTIINYITVI